MSEALVAAKLMRLGEGRFTPPSATTTLRHDRSLGQDLSRIQVRTARDGGNGSILISDQGVDRAGGKQYPAITAADCDVIIGYHPETDVAHVIRPQGKTRYQLRRAQAKNGQIIGIMFEQDYRLTTLDQIKPMR